MPKDPNKRTIKHLRSWQLWTIKLISLLVQLWGRTLRIQLVAPMPKEITQTQGRIVLLWHNSLFALMEIKRRYCNHTPGAGLISASGDGAWLAGLIESMGLKAIRGSSSFRGAGALREAQAWLESGGDLAITPDGPRGPRYRIKPGPALLAKHTQAPIILVCPEFKNSWRFGSWDGFHLPKPFSSIHLNVIFINNLGDLGLCSQPDTQALTQALEAALQHHTQSDRDTFWPQKHKN